MSTQVLDEYTELLLEHRPMVPTNEKELSRLVAILESIDLAPGKPSAAQRRMADLVAAAIVTYEDQICSPIEMSPHQFLQSLMENRNMTQADLARLLNISRTTANHLYHGTQGISKSNALQLSKFFAIDVDVFLA